MFDTVNEIKEVILQSETDQGELRARFEEHEAFAVGEDFETPAGYESYTSPAPQNHMIKVMDGINRSQLALQIKLNDDATEDEQRQASQAELYLFGALNDIDRNLARRKEPPLRANLGYIMSVRGVYCLKAVVYERKGKIYFDVVPWDPLHVTYDYGSFGLLWIARKRRVNKASIFKEYGIEIGGKNGWVTDFWDEDRNSVIIDDTFAKSPTAHKLEEIPILYGTVGSRPNMQNRNGEATLKDQGDSIYNSAIKTFEPTNRFTSQLFDIQSKSITGSIVHESKTGQKKLKGDPHAKYMEIQTEEGEKISMLELQQVPEVTAALLGILDRDAQQSMLPFPTAFGGANENFSGRALVLLADATQSVFTPRTGALGICYRWLSEQLLSQFAQKGKSQEFRGFDANGSFFTVKIKPTDLNKGWFVSAQFTPQLPRDLESDIQTALIATQPNGDGQSIMSMGTAREDIVKMRNPAVEKDKVAAEKGEALPPIQIQIMAAALVKAGKPEIAEQVLALQQPEAAGDQTPAASDDGRIPPDQQLSPEIVQRIAQVFINAGEEELGAGVLSLLGVDIPAEGGAPPQG